MQILRLFNVCNIGALQKQLTYTTHSQCVNPGQCREVEQIEGDYKNSMYQLVMFKIFNFVKHIEKLYAVKLITNRQHEN
jgi:hypothetical protein